MLVSCILPVNKDEGFLDKAVQSILVQTYQNFELIIVANNCTDELWNKVSSYSHEKIKPLRTQIGQLPFALNLGIEHAKGDLIARMDADDIALPERFEKQVEYFKTHPECDILGSDYQAIDLHGNEVNYSRKLYQSDQEIKNKLPISSPLYHPTVMFRKAFIIEVRGYAYEFYAEDYELWLRSRRLGKYHFHNLKDKLLLYRIHAGQATSSERERMPFISEIALRWREFLISKELKFLIGIFSASKLGRWLIILNNKRKGKVIK